MSNERNPPLATTKPQERTRAILRSGLQSTERLVLIAIADYCDAGGRCWPSTRLLASNTGMNERSVRRVLRRLERRGLRVTRRPGQSLYMEVRLHELPEGARNDVPGVGPDVQPVAPEPVPRSVDDRSAGDGSAAVLAITEVRAELHQKAIGRSPGAAWGRSAGLRSKVLRLCRELDGETEVAWVEAMRALARWSYLAPDAAWTRKSSEPLALVLGGRPDDPTRRVERVQAALEWQAAGEPGEPGWREQRLRRADVLAEARRLAREHYEGGRDA